MRIRQMILTLYSKILKKAVSIMGIPFLLCENAYRMGFKRWQGIDYEKTPHVLWSGRTGSGKTVAAKLLIARTIMLAPPELQPVEIIVIDPKSDTDFDFLNGLPKFYRGENAPLGFDLAFEMFRKRQSGEDASRNLILIFCDEFSSLVNLIEEKKQRESTQRKLMLLLLLSRSFRFTMHLAMQQPSAQNFGSGASGSREQFGAVCLLGDSGSETLQMLFDGDSREKIKEYGSIGSRSVGWLSLNGGIVQPVRVPRIQNFDKLHTVIKESMTHN